MAQLVSAEQAKIVSASALRASACNKIASVFLDGPYPAVRTLYSFYLLFFSCLLAFFLLHIAPATNVRLTIALGTDPVTAGCARKLFLVERNISPEFAPHPRTELKVLTVLSVHRSSSLMCLFHSES